MNTTVDVASDHIAVWSSFADVLVCSRLGGKWEVGRRAWSFPATEEVARKLRKNLRGLAAADATTLDDFISGSKPHEQKVLRAAGEPAGLEIPGELPAPVAAPVEAPAVVSEVLPSAPPVPDVTVPQGMLTQPWRHQKAAFKFCLDRFAAGFRGILLAMGMGCIEGDAEIVINRRGCARRMTLREFHRKFHGGETNGRRWRDYPSRTRSIIAGELRLNHVLDVIAQGVKPVLRITLASGKSLRVTPDHEIACPDERWIEAGRLAPGDMVLTNGVPACESCGHDNRPENLEVLPASEHYGHHGKNGGYIHLDGAPVHFVPKADTVMSVQADGEADVYDVRMASPGNNFVVNGIIVHNCGKSLVACMLVLALAARRILIACPLRVVQVWVTQFERHVGVPVILVALDEDVASVSRKQQLAAEKLKLAAAIGIPFVAVINYDSVWREPFGSWAENVAWDVIFADEAHRIKSPSGKASLAFKRLRLHANHRVALTGTPMPHGPMDVYAQFRFLDIRIFGPSFSAFRQKYAVMGGYQRKQITGFQKLDELEALMSKITFRVGPEVLDLPPATHVTYKCDLDSEAARIYRDLEEDFVARVLDGTVTAANAMVKLLRLQQVTGGCVPTDDGTTHRVDSSKQKLLADTLEDIGKDEPVVVFCRFHADLDAVHQACETNGYSSLELSGRRDELKRWQDGEAQVLAVQISAGGIGVDLTRARYSAYYSLSFSLGEYDQALARVHRPGQTRPVEHIHLVARNTVDVKIMRALEKRAEIVQAILAEIKN